MPVQIGAKRESNFDDPLGLLSDCHRRIERFLAVLTRLSSELQGAALSEDHRRSLDTALKYFRESARRHTADEEESLFPRLRERGLTERLESLDADHERAQRIHAEVDRLGELWLSRGRLSTDETRNLSGAVTELGELYRQHIAIEDKEVFPAAAAALTSKEIEAVGAEMVARRGLHFEPPV